METLIALGLSIAPFAIECAVTISIVALAALLAARLLGHHQPARSFTCIAVAFALGALLVFGHSEGPLEGPTADLPVPARVHASRLPPERDGAIPTATPGLIAKYGSMFQVRFSGKSPKGGLETAPAEPSRGTWSGWMGPLGILWLLGLGAVSAYHFLGILAIRASLSLSRPCQDRRLLHLATTVREALDAGSAELRLSPANRVAFLVGIVHPRIVLPQEALGWPDARVTSTLLHEYMHVKRFDIPVAEALRLLASLAWFSPLPWMAFSSALRFREEACDEAVLRAGIAPAGYAADLLATARSLSQRARAAATAAIVGGSQLERRIRAILERPAVLSRRDSLLRNASAALLLTASIVAVPHIAPLSALPELDLGARHPPGPGEWLAVPDPWTSRPKTPLARGAFSLSQEGGYARICLTIAGRASEFRLPAVAMPSALPLTARARMILPFGDLVDAASQRPFLNPGWTIWDDREVLVKAAGAGRVVVARVDLRHGPIVEVDHGAGLRTRYGFGRHGSSAVQVSEYVAAGTPLGAFGDFSPLDIPSLSFGILVQARGQWIALDPAPFLFAAGENRATPLGTSVLNASIRIEDRAQVQRLLARGISLNRVAADGTLPLEWIILTQNLAIGKDLLAAGADPQAVTWDTHQAHIALHGPSIADLAKATANPALIALLTPE